MDKCDLCTGCVTYPDDFVRGVVAGKDYARPIHLCPECLEELRKCRLCRWFNGTNKCLESPYTVSKKPNDGCGQWRQKRPIVVQENEREEVMSGSPKFFMV